MYKEVDFTNVKIQGGGSLVPEGQYNVKIIGTYDKQATTGSPMVEIEYQILDGEYLGFILKDRLVFHENSYGFFKHFLKVIEEPYEGKIFINTNNWRNKKLRILNVHTVSNNKKYNNIKQHFSFKEDIPSSEIQQSTNSQYESPIFEQEEEIPF